MESIENIPQQRAGPPTKEAIQQFLKYARRHSPDTQRLYRDTLWKFSDYLPAYIENVTPEHIDIFLQSLKLSANSKNTCLIAIRAFFKYLETYHGLPNISKKVKRLKAQPFRQRVISESEYKKILEVLTPNEKDNRIKAAKKIGEKAVIRFLANTGLRASEFSELTPNSISPDGKFITVIGKGRKRRIIPLNKTCRECWPKLFYKEWNKDKLAWLCKKISQKSGITLFYPHSLRHFFCTRMVNAGVSLVKVSRMLGHSSIAVTERVYLHLLPCDYLGLTDVLKEESEGGE